MVKTPLQLGTLTRAALVLLRLAAASEVFRVGYLVGSYRQVGPGLVWFAGCCRALLCSGCSAAATHMWTAPRHVLHGIEVLRAARLYRPACTACTAAGYGVHTAAGEPAQPAWRGDCRHHPQQGEVVRVVEWETDWVRVVCTPLWVARKAAPGSSPPS